MEGRKGGSHGGGREEVMGKGRRKGGRKEGREGAREGARDKGRKCWGREEWRDERGGVMGEGGRK